MEQLNFFDVITCKCGKDSEFYYKNSEYCSSCLLKKLKIKIVDYIKFYKNGRFLGDTNFDIIKTFKKVDLSIERR